MALQHKLYPSRPKLAGLLAIGLPGLLLGPACTQDAGRAAADLTPPPPVMPNPGPAARAVSAQPAPAPALAQGFTRTISDWAATLEPLGNLPGTAPGAAPASGLRLDLPDTPLGAYVRTDAPRGAGLALQTGQRSMALGVLHAPQGLGITAGLEDRYRAPWLHGASISSRVGTQGGLARADVALEQGFGAVDYRVAVHATDTPHTEAAQSVDVFGRAGLPGGAQLRGYWQSAPTPGIAGQTRLDLSLRPGTVPVPWSQAAGAHCASGAFLSCGINLDWKHRAWTTRVSPQWRTAAATPDRAGLDSVLSIELSNALQHLELVVPTSGGRALRGLGYRVQIPLH